MKISHGIFSFHKEKDINAKEWRSDVTDVSCQGDFDVIYKEKYIL